MERKVIDLEIVDELEGSGVEAIALVDAPAIEKNFMYFRQEKFVEPRSGESQEEYMGRCVPVLIDEGKEQDQAVAICISNYENMSKDFVYDEFADYPWDECIDDQLAKGLDEESANNICGWIRSQNMAETSFTDYPESAKENAKRALAYAETNGWGDCGTPVGKARANQLANGEPISLDTIARMASFERHRQNSTTPYGEGCGKLMWDAWGGDEGIAWAQRKLEQEQKLSMEFAKVSFDFDDTLSTAAGLELAKKYKDGGDTLYIISARNDVSQDMLDRASELGIPESRIFATGSNKAKVAKVTELGITKHIDNNADVINELGNIGIKFAEECPPATQDIKINLENRQNAIDIAHYGPLNPNEPNEEYWTAKAAMFNSTVDEAKSARCGNCAFFNTSEAVKACIASGIGGESEDPYNVIDAGELGYCEAFDFKCASARTCDAWVVRTEKMEIDTTALPTYIDQIGKKKKKEMDFSAVLQFAKTAGFVAEDFISNGLKFSEETESIDLELAKGYTVYKYTGSVGSDTRDFCREMVGLDRFYTFEEINAMGSMAVNPGFGLEGAATYDIWKYKGGPNCKHRWTKFYINENGTAENKGAAPGIAGEKPNDMTNHGYAFATIEDKMELVGPVAIPDIEIPRKDNDGNLYFVRFSKEVVRRMAEKFMREQRLAESNIQHDSEQDGKSYVYESWIVENPEDKANSVYNLDVPVGTWMCKMRVTDPIIWSKVKSGEVKGFSLEGSFMDRKDWEQYQKDREIYNKVLKILKNS